MKKLLIIIVITLILALTCVTVVSGLHMGNLSILGIKEIKSEDQNLKQKIDEATKLASITYSNELTALDSNLKEMKAEKQKYEDRIATTTQSEMQIAIQEPVYTIDKIWSKIGKYATDEGLDATFELKAGTRIPVKKDNEEADYKYYDIKFTVLGGYANISLYMSDIENDSQLGFKFENFKMEPSGDGVKATFTCKDIAIKEISTSTISTQNEQSKPEDNGAETNTTGTNNTATNNTNTAEKNTTGTNTTATNTTGTNTTVTNSTSNSTAGNNTTNTTNTKAQ